MRHVFEWLGFKKNAVVAPTSLVFGPTAEQLASEEQARAAQLAAAEAKAKATSEEARRVAAHVFAAKLRQENAFKRFPWLRYMPKPPVHVPSDWLVTVPVTTEPYSENGYQMWYPASFLRSDIHNVEPAWGSGLLRVNLTAECGRRCYRTYYYIKAADKHLLEHP